MPKNKRVFLPAVVPHETIERRIYLVRGRKVMLDRDLADLYGVLAKVLNQAVKRNMMRFPDDFMFQLTKDEAENWKSQIVTSKSNALRSQIVTLKRGQHLKYRPYAFTEQGIAMLSSVLKSKRAVQANIQIMRTFVKIKEMITNNEMLRQKIEELERKYQKHDAQFKVIFEAIREVLEKPHKQSKREVGFHTNFDRGDKK